MVNNTPHTTQPLPPPLQQQMVLCAVGGLGTVPYDG